MLHLSAGHSLCFPFMDVSKLACLEVLLWGVWCQGWAFLTSLQDKIRHMMQQSSRVGLAADNGVFFQRGYFHRGYFHVTTCAPCASHIPPRAAWNGRCFRSRGICTWVPTSFSCKQGYSRAGCFSPNPLCNRLCSLIPSRTHTCI